MHIDSVDVMQNIDRTMQCDLKNSHRRDIAMYRSFVDLSVSILNMIQNLTHKLREKALIVNRRIILILLCVMKCLFAYFSHIKAKNCIITCKSCIRLHSSRTRASSIFEKFCNSSKTQHLKSTFSIN